MEGNIFDFCLQVLEDDGWEFEIHGAGDSRRVRFGFLGEHARIECMLITYEETDRICFLSSAQAVVPEVKRLAVAEYLTRANYGIILGNFEMDFRDGETRFKTSADVEGIELTARFVKNLIVSNLGTADKYYPGLMKVIYANMDPADAIAVVRESH